MSYFNARTLNPMSEDHLRQYAPSIFATQPYEGVSKEYRFIPTSDIITQLSDEGFVPVTARESRTRIDAKRGYTKHEVRFAHRDLLQSDSPAMVVGGTYPLAVLTNSHDTGSSFKIDAGMYRLACSNGMMLPSSIMAGAKVRHTGDISDVIEGVFSVVHEMATIPQMIESYSKIILPRPAQLAFASAALELRESTLPLIPEQLLAVRRTEDNKDDLWNITNRIQENLMKGGLRSRTTTGRRASTREVKDINADQRMNKSLFIIAEALRKGLS